MTMKDPLIEWLIKTTPLKRDTWVLECQLYRILLSYIRGNLDSELIKNTNKNTLAFMSTFGTTFKCYEERTLLKILVEQCDWSVDMFVRMIEEKKGRL